jgi:hypothetical protein
MQIFNTRAELEEALRTGTVCEHIVLDEVDEVDEVDQAPGAGTYYLGRGDLTEEQKVVADALEKKSLARRFVDSLLGR